MKEETFINLSVSIYRPKINLSMSIDPTFNISLLSKEGVRKMARLAIIKTTVASLAVPSATPSAEIVFPLAFPFPRHLCRKT